ncbi:MAG: MFS transporter [Proteobacteria bacterium]|nr:MFS transporter [Pseudomonadota bacterium]MBU1739042.1 MFS transporter [Pseudomonadota bacterium]
MNSNEQKLTWLAGFSHFITHGYMSLLPAVLVMITAEHSMSFTDIGIIANIGYFLYGLGAIPAGYLSDKFGSKRVLTFGVGGMALSSLLVGVSQGIWGFAVCYAFLGAFASIHHPAGLSLIARRVESAKGKALGIHGVLGNVGIFLTPLVAVLGIKFFHTWRAAYVLYGLVGILFAVMMYLSRVDDEPDLHWRSFFRWGGALRDPVDDEVAVPGSATGQAAPAKGGADLPGAMLILPVSLLLLYCGSILSGFIFRGSLTFMPSLLQQEVHFITSSDEPVVLAGTVTTVVLSLGLIGAWFGGWINDKIKRPEFFPIILFAIVAPLLYMVSSMTDNGLLSSISLFSLFYYAWQPSHNYLISRYTKKASHGMGFGVNFFLIFGVGSIATAIGGYVADDFGVDRFYLVMAVIAVAALAAAIGVYLVKPYLIKGSLHLVRENNNAR